MVVARAPGQGSLMVSLLRMSFSPWKIVLVSDEQREITQLVGDPPQPGGFSMDSGPYPKSVFPRIDLVCL